MAVLREEGGERGEWKVKVGMMPGDTGNEFTLQCTVYLYVMHIVVATHMTSTVLAVVCDKCFCPKKKEEKYKRNCDKTGIIQSC